MATANIPYSSTSHAAALARILRVTQQAWELGQHQDRLQPRAPAQAPLSRRARLALAAARAFEAQVMAMRCQQVLVG
ncbi:hypothetical protein [Cupriavidus sp. UYPR2.512]|uniref:hypothetical protein n=1 Tax=Cupriavidus sp. UYPR2.512 TaxID=1080187 RepID=UPI00037B692E|nr:hypothetical protein [Cupriavidus sp. UYPR2.512]UIF89556.1 hypothetical protein KAF44_37685 [Cupriavidus necator]